MAKNRSVTEPGVLVELRAFAYLRDDATGQVHRGPTGGAPGTPRHRPGSGKFRIAQWRWDRDARLPESARIFSAVDEPTEQP